MAVPLILARLGLSEYQTSEISRAAEEWWIIEGRRPCAEHIGRPPVYSEQIHSPHIAGLNGLPGCQEGF